MCVCVTMSGTSQKKQVAVFATSESLVTALTSILERLTDYGPVTAIPIITNDPPYNGRSIFESHRHLLKPLLQHFKRVIVCICFCEDRPSCLEDFMCHVSPKARKRCEFICWDREEPDSVAKRELQALLHLSCKSLKQ